MKTFAIALSLSLASCGVEVALPGLPPGVADELTPDQLPTCSEIGADVEYDVDCGGGFARCYGGDGDGAWQVEGCRHGAVICIFDCP